MNPERISLPSYWRTRKERYSLIGEKYNFPNPGQVVMLRGKLFHLEENGKTLKPLSEEEARKLLSKIDLF